MKVLVINDHYGAVTSESDPHKIYLVYEDRKLRWHCQCMDHVMRVNRGENDQCKHVKEFLKEIEK
jgi:hypothetical protein